MKLDTKIQEKTSQRKPMLNIGNQIVLAKFQYTIP